MRELTQTDISMLDNMNQSIKMSQFATMTHGEALAFGQMWWWLQGFLKELKEDFNQSEQRKKLETAIARAKEIKDYGKPESVSNEVPEAKHDQGSQVSEGSKSTNRGKDRGPGRPRKASG